MLSLFQSCSFSVTSSPTVSEFCVFGTTPGKERPRLRTWLSPEGFLLLLSALCCGKHPDGPHSSFRTICGCRGHAGNDWAAEHNHWAVVELLIRYRAHVHALGRFDKSPSDVALDKNDPETR